MQQKKWGFWVLTAFVVGNMVGAGIFMVPSTLAQTASPLGVTLAWLTTGFGVLMLALVFGNLAIRRPDLTTGPQSHAYALFSSPKKKKMAGFSMVWGYWVANWASNVAIITSFAGYLSLFFPIMKDTRLLFSIGSFNIEVGKLITFTICSILLWGTHIILTNGVSGAGKLNFLATTTKVTGFLLFIVVTLFAFEVSKFGQWYTPMIDKSGVSHGLLSQVNLAALTTLWAFIGIESAVLLSNRATSPKTVKRATVAGLLITVAIYLGITILTMGVLHVDKLQASERPLADALNAAMGHGGGKLMALLALTSLFGSILGWILLSSEVPYQAAKEGFFPSFFTKTNKKGSPIYSLRLTNIMSQVFLFSTLSGTIAEAYTFVITVSTLAYLIPYLVSPIFQLKLVATGETYKNEMRARITDGIVAVIALCYALWVIKTGASDIKTFLLGIGLFVIGFAFYPLMNRDEKKNKEKKNGQVA
ncbi:amino acid permease [Bacillus wiedmannii]|uniref:amino acid permease n=1 Tax=Bacillus wiedmannii TaxID=1890302 RepID=UPI000B435C83|nr:arginine:ornithine antiporter [Bacillus thuringiensis serovar argentinensis]